MRTLPPIAALRRALAALLLAALVVPAVAHADYRELLRDACNDGSVSGTYSQADYRKALANIPADALQYTDCKDVLRSAQLAAASRQSTSGRRPSTPAGRDSGPIAHIAQRPAAKAPSAPKAGEQSALAKATHSAPTSSAPIAPSAIGVVSEPATSDLPTPLLVALVLVLLGALAGLILYLLPRVRERRSS